MGRSGVGGGGGGRSGGGRSGGSRSSGRSSMGSSSSRSFSSGRSGRSSTGSFSSGRSAMGGMGRTPGGAGGMGAGPRPGGMRPGPRPMGMGAGMYRRPAGGVGRRRTGGIGTVLVIVIWLIIVAAAFSSVRVSYGPGYSQTGSGSSDITKSTVNRDKLHLNLSDETGYFTDECGWIRNRTTLEKGLKDFYDNTGIIPYVYIINNVSGDYDPSTEKLEQFAAAKYDALFKDEGHALLVFWDYAGAYEYVLWLGNDAAELMDTEACDILFDYLDYYYYYADTEEEFFADAFANAGERIMSVTRSPIYYIIIVVAAGAVVFAVYKVWKSRKDKEAARKKRAEEILNSPLEKFGDNGDIIDDLEKKYEKEI